MCPGEHETFSKNIKKIIPQTFEWYSVKTSTLCALDNTDSRCQQMVDVQPFTSGEVLSHVGHLAAGMTPSVLS